MIILFSLWFFSNRFHSSQTGPQLLLFLPQSLKGSGYKCAGAHGLQFCDTQFPQLLYTRRTHKLIHVCSQRRLL